LSRSWIVALIPIALLSLLVFVIVRTEPTEKLRGEGVPPVERLAVDRALLTNDGIVLTVLNDGPDPVTIAQVVVDDAFWSFRAEGGTVLNRLGRTRLVIPYPWVEGEAHAIKLVTSTGATFEHEIPVAVRSPEPDGRYIWTFTLIGLYVGVVPVALGLLWLPLIRTLGRSGLDVLLALTVGLLAFLFVDAAHEGLDAAAAIPESYQGFAIFVATASAAYLGLEWLGSWLRARRVSAKNAGSTGYVLATLIAIGIGLHNFGEGLAIGAAYALGEAALGTLLVIGFTLHNTTEGLAIVAPIASERPTIGALVKLGLIGGAPTIVGAWVGGLAYSPVLGVLFLGLGAGAIAQVALQIARQLSGERPLSERFASAPVMGGLFAGFAVMYVTGLLVG
jgi:zinc transporter ZupT